MTKKTSKKTKKAVKKPAVKQSKINEKLIDNAIALQEVLTNLAIKIEDLTQQTSKLLTLFELSAKSFIEKQDMPFKKQDRILLQKIEQLLEQNKTIAKGVSIVERKVGAQPPQRPPQQFAPPPPKRSRLGGLLRPKTRGPPR